MFNSTSLPKILDSALKAGDSYLWNGPLCPTCRRGYCGTHTCSVDDLQRQIDALQAKIDALRS